MKMLTKKDVPESKYRALNGRLVLVNKYVKLLKQAKALNVPNAEVWAWVEFKKEYIKNPTTQEWEKL